MTDNRLPALRIAIRLTLAAAAAAALSTPQTSIAQRADSASRGGAGRARELPLKPARTIRLTTDEGTWMSLDISPNGQSLVFDLAGFHPNNAGHRESAGARAERGDAPGGFRTDSRHPRDALKSGAGASFPRAGYKRRDSGIQ